MALRDLLEQAIQRQQLENQVRRETAEQFTPSAGQVANVLGMFAPGAASLEATGQYSSMGPYDQPYNEAFSNPPNPSIPENIERGGFGGYGMAGLQALGVLGDATYAASPVIGATLGTALKFPAALATVAKAAVKGKGILPLDKTGRLQRAKDMGFRTDEPVYHGTHSKDIDAFDDKFIGNRDEGFFGRGHYFTSESGEASYYGPNVGEYYTRGKLLDLSQTKKNSNYELMDKDYFKFWTKELDKIDMLDEPTKKGLKTINKIDDYVDNNVKFIKGSDNRGNDGIAAYVKSPSQYGQEKIYSNFGLADKETAIKSLKNNIIDETQYKSDLKRIFPNTDNILYSLSDYIRVGGKGADELSKQAKKAGYDGIKVGDETVIFDPKNIRSKDAEFDPKKTESPNLQSSLGKPPTGGIRALSYSDKTQLA